MAWKGRRSAARRARPKRARCASRCAAKVPKSCWKWPTTAPAWTAPRSAAAAKSALGTASQVVSNATNTAQQVQSGVAAADSFLGSLGIDTSSFVTGSFLN